MNPRKATLLGLSCAAIVAVLIVRFVASPVANQGPQPRIAAVPSPDAARVPPASLAARPSIVPGPPNSPPSAKEDPGFALVFHIHDAAGSGIAAAEIVAWDASETLRATSDSKGNARLSLAAGGEHQVRVAADGFVAEDAREVIPKRGEDTPVEVQLVPGIPFDGRVLAAEDDRPIAGAGIRVEARGSFEGYSSMSSHHPYDRTRSDESGRFHVRGIPPGELATVVAEVDGRRRGELSVKAEAATVRPAEIVLRLQAGGTVKGVVRGPNGKGVGDATVYVIPADAQEIRRNPRVRTMSGSVTTQAERAATRDDGSYSVFGLALDREYVAVAEARTLARSAEATGLVCTSAAPVLRVDLPLRRPAALVLHIVDERGSLVERPKVRIGHPMGDVDRDAPDPDGAYRFEGLPPGKHDLHVRSQMFIPVDREVELAEGATLDLRIALRAGARIEGVVAAGDGSPVAKATIGFARIEEGKDKPELEYYGERSFESDATGRFVLGGLEPGRYLLGAHAVGFEVPVPIRATAPSADVRIAAIRLGRAHLLLVRPDGTPYSGDTYEWREDAGGGGGGGRTIENGRFEVVGLDGKKTILDLEFDDFAPVHLDVTTAPGEDRDLGRVQLEAGVELVGRIVDRERHPVAGAQVATGRDREAAADRDGRFSLAHVARGATTLRVSAEGFLPQTLEATAGAVPGVEVVLDRGALIKGVVKDAGGRRVQEDVFIWRVDADGNRLDEEEEMVTPEDDGSFSQRLPAGRYRFVARAATEDVKPPPLGDFLLVEGETKDVVLTLPAK